MLQSLVFLCTSVSAESAILQQGALISVAGNTWNMQVKPGSGSASLIGSNCDFRFLLHLGGRVGLDQRYARNHPGEHYCPMSEVVDTSTSIARRLY